MHAFFVGFSKKIIKPWIIDCIYFDCLEMINRLYTSYLSSKPNTSPFPVTIHTERNIKIIFVVTTPTVAKI